MAHQDLPTGSEQRQEQIRAGLGEAWTSWMEVEKPEMA